MRKVNPPNVVKELMKNEAEKRAQKYNTIVCDKLPHYRDMSCGSYLGYFSISDPVKHVRYIRSTAAVDIGNGIQSVTDIGRDWVSSKYGHLRTTGLSLRLCLQDRPFPIFVQPGAETCSHYLDLKSAYWSIVRAVGIDLDYRPGQYLHMGHSVDDFPLPDNKIARSSIVSSGHSSNLKIWRGDHIQTIRKNGRNNLLWALVMDILNAVAADMVSVGALYCYSDGYIVPDDCLIDAIEVLNGWRLSYSVKARGETFVYGINQYKVGSKQTRIFDVLKTPCGYAKITSLVDRDWLRHQFTECYRIRHLHTVKGSINS